MSEQLEFGPGPEKTQRTGGYVFAVIYCVMATIIGVLLYGRLAEANLVLVYLLAVVLTTVQFGRGPGMLASCIAVLGFDMFFVLPHHSLMVADPQYLLTFLIMLVVSLIISHLAANQRHLAMIALDRERRAFALFKLSQELSSALTTEQIDEVAVRHLDLAFQARVLLLTADRAGKLDVARLETLAGRTNIAAAIAAGSVYDSARNGNAESMTMLGGLLYLPLRAPMRTRGVLVVRNADGGRHVTDESSRLLQTFAAQIALAIERVHYVDVARETEIAMASERLRNSLLSAVSHDIRTPLTTIVGLSSTLASSPALSSKGGQDLAAAIQGAALRMNSLVTNLLDMARLNAGAVRLNREWQMIEEVIGSALASLDPTLDSVELDIVIDPSLPLVCFDAVLIERVLCNLIDNALKYAADGSFVRIAAVQHAGQLEVSVEDRGPGVPEGMEEDIFVKFVRGEKESNKNGVGVGLAICRAIVEYHGGHIRAARSSEGGARFVFTLPLGTPPVQASLEEGFDRYGEAP